MQCACIDRYDDERIFVFNHRLRLNSCYILLAFFVDTHLPKAEQLKDGAKALHWLRPSWHGHPSVELSEAQWDVIQP